MMEDAIKQVAAALRDKFMETVEKTADMPFQDTGVTVPKNEVWEGYAERAVLTFLETAERDPEAAEACESAWLAHVRR